MKIYTKTGDKGETSLFGGERVPKYHARIHAYGTIDELNSFLGLIRDQKIKEHYRESLSNIQSVLFTLGSHLATKDRDMQKVLPPIVKNDVDKLENEIDEMDKELPQMKNFILPGGHTTVSYIHVARAICRRAERELHEIEEDINPLIHQYINRLSDYLFTLARKVGQDLGVREILWNV